MSQTPAFRATLHHTNGQTTTTGYPKEAGKPSPQSAAGFLAVVRAHEVTADVVKVDIVDNRGNRGVLATAGC